ncbi:endoribonuclease L-PSP family protein [Microdochium trichocladiopsis]|uniref:Endoribonuclease L-PSP family protein n=1 Tax=Microdochium trichocladiopsis TaxID=1682393 RepID=A0A9P8YD69_9PEZI|nr:endoribonuclease L-PSP family protein [Microdochium trichocladiopsis]KAH7034677.1 endoribonuclease L-PSP family protein [Microdochium trichocladiopsis]
MAQYFQTPNLLGQAYQAFGYSHAVVLPLNAQLVIAAGQPGVDARGNMVTSSPKDQIEACFDNCDLALKTAGVTSGLASAHKVHCFVTDIKDEAAVMEVWKSRYPEHRPTWMTLGIKELAAPGMLVEIQVEAHLVANS